MARNKQCQPGYAPGTTARDIDGEPSAECCCCGEPTNMPADDDRYSDNGDGPYCDECWESRGRYR